MIQAFISHSSKDRSIVERSLIPFLKKNNVEPWYSTDAIPGGELWEHELRKNLDRSDVVFLVVTENATPARTPWVQTEIMIAMRSGTPVIPLVLDETQPDQIYSRLVRRQHIDYRSANRRKAKKKISDIITRAAIDPTALVMPVIDLEEERRKAEERSKAAHRKTSRRRVLAGVVGVLLAVSAPWVIRQFPPPAVSALEISPARLSLTVDQTAKVFATAVDEAGELVRNGKVQWTSANSDLIRAEADGTVMGLRPGEAVLYATCQGVVAEIPVTILPLAKCGTVRILGAPAVLTVGRSHPLSVELIDEHGKSMESGLAQWSTSNPTIARVSRQGIVEALREGRVEITASCGDTRDGATISVNERPRLTSMRVIDVPASLRVGDEAALTPVLGMSDGTTTEGLPVTWSSSRTSIATVSPKGTVRGISAGAVTITAIAEGVSGEATIRVTHSPPASIRIESDGILFVEIGDEVRLEATVRDDHGRVLQAGVEWSSDDPSVVSISPNGLARARSEGQASITARCGTVTDSVVIGAIVIVPPPATPMVREMAISSLLGEEHYSFDTNGALRSIHLVNMFDRQPIPFLSGRASASSDSRFWWHVLVEIGSMFGTNQVEFWIRPDGAVYQILPGQVNLSHVGNATFYSS